MKGLLFAALTSLLVVTTASAVAQLAPAVTPTVPPPGTQFEKPVLDYLLPAVERTGKPARIYLQATCPVENGSIEDVLNGNIGFVYGKADVDLSTDPDTGITAVQHLLRNDPQAPVVQDRFGLIRIAMRNVSTTILQTRIPRLALSKYAQYTALTALDELLNTPELQDAEKRLHVRLRNHVVDHIEGYGRGPHLPPLLQDVTVDQTLDAIAQTFNGVIVYGICRMPDGGAWFDVRFLYDGRGSALYTTTGELNEVPRHVRSWHLSRN